MLIGHALGSIAAVSGKPGAVQTAAYWAALLGQALPDLDAAVYLVRGRTGMLKHHATWTHSPLVGIPASLALAAVAQRLWPGAPFWHVWASAAVGWGLHVLVDVLNPEGTMAGWPWSRKRLARDVLPLFDPVVTLLLLIPVLARLSGVARDASGLAVAAWAALAGVAAYAAVRAAMHERALRRARNLVAGRGPPPEDVSVLPIPHGPRTWTYVVRQPGGGYRFGDIDAVSGRAGDERELRPDLHPAVEASRRHRPVADFLSFARFPVAQVIPGPAYTTVRWRDVQFAARGESRPWLEASVTLPANGPPGHPGRDHPGGGSA